MMTDEKVEMAKSIALAIKKELEQNVSDRKMHPTPRDFKFPRAEWEKWRGYVSKAGLDSGIRLLEYMEKSPSLRHDPRNAASCMHRVIRGRQTSLRQIPLNELVEIFGYVGRWLVWLNFTQEIVNEERPSRHPGRDARRRHGSH